MKKAMKQSRLIFLLNLSSLIILLIILVCLGLTSMQSKIADKANEDRFNLTENATRFMEASAYMTSEVRAYAATADKQHYNNYMNEMNQLKTRESSIQNMKTIGVTSQEQSKIDEMLAISNQLIKLEEESMKYVTEGDLKNAVKIVLGAEYNNEITKIRDMKLDFLNMLFKRTTEQVNKQVNNTRILEIFTFIVILAIVILQIISYQIIRKRVIRPIIGVEKEMRCIASGNLSSEFDMEPDTSEIGMLVDSMLSTRSELRKYIKDISDKLAQMAKQNLLVDIDIDYIGDFSPIKEALIKIVSSLNSALYKIDETADQVAVGSSQISDIAQDLASGTCEQAASIEQVSATIANISEKIQNTAKKSGMASELANAAGIQLNQSNEQLKGMLQAMNEISDASGEIGKIIKTIEDIAFQTNTIALNAAVEASRAGEAGKSFAVVAGEVRNLANKSAQASKNTSQMIENSLHTIRNGAKIAQEASNTFVTVMINAGHAADAMSSISNDTKLQAQDIIEITQSIEQISDVIQRNSTTSEESAVSSEQLMQQSQSLRDLVHEFQIKQNAANSLLTRNKKNINNKK